MKSAYYRIPGAPGRVALLEAAFLTSQEQRVVRFGGSKLFCPNCGEQVFFSQASDNKKPGQKGFRPAHFKHQAKRICVVEDCDLRVDMDDSSGKYISQRLRTPLFLRPSDHGFVLSAGFTTSNKEALRQLQERRFNKLFLRRGRNTLFEISIDELLQETEDGILYFDLPFIISKTTPTELSVENGFHEALSMNEANLEWSNNLDWFADQSGAVFQYSAGNAGEKIPSGSCILSGRPYLMIEKDSGTRNSFLPISCLDKMVKKYGFVYEGKGSLYVNRVSTRYFVHKVVFPSSREMSGEDYEALSDWLREHFAVLLCDELPETRPVWPPASRKGDAYAVQAASGSQAYILASGVTEDAAIHIHKDYETTVELPVSQKHGLLIGSIPLATRRLPVSFSGLLSGTVASYRAEPFHPAPHHCITINHDALLLNNPGHYSMECPEDGKLVLSSSCEYTIYRRGLDPETVAPGVEHQLSVSPDTTLSLYTSAGILFDVRIKQPQPLQPANLEADDPEQDAASFSSQTQDTRDALDSAYGARKTRYLRTPVNRYSRY